MDRTAALVLLLAFIIVGSSFSTATAHYMNAKIEIYKAITIPVIDGKYDMTLRETDINDTKVMVDEWNDATWIELPRRIGNLTAYSGYKYVVNDREQALYIAHDILSITELNSEFFYSAGTAFDPKHDGGNQKAKPDDFVVLPMWNLFPKDGFAVYMRYGQFNGDFGDYENPPVGLAANSTICATPFSSTPHLFYEVRVPLSLGNLYKSVDSTIGFDQDCYNQNPSTNDGLYPMGQGDFIVNNWADATFSKRTDPNITAPPTIVPEFPIRAAPLVIVATLVALVLISKRKLDVQRGMCMCWEMSNG